MKTKLSRAKALAACMSAFCVMTASWSLPGYVGNVSADAYGLQPESQSGSESHIIDETLFPDDEFRAYVCENVDTDHDGYVTVDELLAVTYIKSEFGSIKSLQGIKYFRNLRTLEVRHNQITELDVSGLPNLTWLGCQGNGMVTLDASNCPKLSTIYCNDNELTSVNVQNDVKLADFFCYDNHLTELDVSDLVNLYNLDCDRNDLSILVVMENERVTYLSCRGNQNMEWLIVCGCPNLLHLDCAECNLKEALLFGNDKLDVLYCFGNQLHSLPAFWETETPRINAALKGTKRVMSDGVRVTYHEVGGSGYVMADLDMPVVTDYTEYALSEPVPIDNWKLNQLPVVTPTPTPTPVPTATPTPTPTPKPTATPTPTPVPSNVYTGNMAGRNYRISASNGWTVTSNGNNTYTFSHKTNGTVVFQVCNWGYPVFVLNNPGATNFLRNKGIYWGGWRQDLIQARSSDLTAVWYQMGIRIEVL